METEPAARVHWGCLVTHHMKEEGQGLSWAAGAVGGSARWQGFRAQTRVPKTQVQILLNHSP